jgi:pimeloyl-ACP methyl ester carboxylesterase
MISRPKLELLARCAAVGIGLALTCVVCVSSSFANDLSERTSPRFEFGLCPASVAKLMAGFHAECGFLTVPENRTKHNRRTIRLPVAIIPSKFQPPQPDPVVHLSGGPGSDALGDAEFLVPADLNRKRDLIIMGQRGTLDTEPELTCPEIDHFNAELVGLRYDSDETKRRHVAATRKCHDRLVSEGIDLSAYNTRENAADFVDLFKVMKIKRWNVYGYSYGTNLALTLMRDHPDGIRSVIIDSVLPPSVATLGWTWTNVNEAFNNLFRACAAKPACKSKYGDLAAKFASQVQQLEANPLTTKARHSPSAPPVKVVLDGGALVNWLVAAGPGFAKVPSAIEELVQGSPTQIAQARAGLANPAGVGQFGYGLTYGVFCSELVPFEPESQILVQGLLAFPTYPKSVLSQAPQLPYETEDCEVWNVPKAPPSVRQVTISSIPTLVIAGSFDAKTSPQWAVYAASTLQNSTTIVIPGIGHWVTPQSDCAQRVVASFLANPASPPDINCVAKLSPPSFN